MPPDDRDQGIAPASRSPDAPLPAFDVIVVGSGPAGLAAAIAARDAGASVAVIEENSDIGGHGMLSGGNIQLGGGHSLQKQLGIEDGPELIFYDWTRPDLPETRFNDRELTRIFASENAATFEFLLDNGVTFYPHPSLKADVNNLGPASVPRVFQCHEWDVKAEVIAPHRGRNGSGLVRALAKSARRKGVVLFLGHRLTGLVRHPGRPTEFTVETLNDGATVELRAIGGVVLATGGSSGDVTFRRIFDPRLTEEYQQVGAPYSRQSADGERAALAHGASLWATGSQTAGTALVLAKTWHIGCRWGYKSLVFEQDSPIFPLAKATGLTVTDWQNLVLVNQIGQRFWDETDDSPGFFDAALSYTHRTTDPNGGGPIWAIFDAAAAEREGWNTTPPHVDRDGYFFQEKTLEELSRAITNTYQKTAMPAENLVHTVARYNDFVATGADVDFGKPSPRYAIARPPFYAAWATPMVHDSLTGLRTDATGRVLDLYGGTIDGLYCAGETQGGFAQHGLGRCLVFGRIAGRSAASRSCADQDQRIADEEHSH